LNQIKGSRADELKFSAQAKEWKWSNQHKGDQANQIKLDDWEAKELKLSDQLKLLETNELKLADQLKNLQANQSKH
jgi:hypothetical protein